MLLPSWYSGIEKPVDLAMLSGSMCSSISMRSGKCLLGSSIITCRLVTRNRRPSRSKKKPLAFVSRPLLLEGDDACRGEEKGFDHRRLGIACGCTPGPRWSGNTPRSAWPIVHQRCRGVQRVRVPKRPARTGYGVSANLPERPAGRCRVCAVISVICSPLIASLPVADRSRCSHPDRSRRPVRVVPDVRRPSSRR